MTRKKPYDDGCASAHALDIIGERWALLIVRELVPGPARFSDLKAGLPGISTNILTTRLAELEAAHIVLRRQLPPPAQSVQVYALTAWGADLEPLIREIGRWAARSPNLVAGKPMSRASVLLSFRTMFDGARAGDMDAELEIVLSGRPHRARIEGGTLDIAPGRAVDPDATVAGDQNLLVAAVYGGVPLGDVEAQGLSLTGDRDVIQRFLSLFPLPEKAPAHAPGDDPRRAEAR